MEDKVEVTFDGAPLSKIGDKVVIFAKEDKENFFQLNEKAYIILNSYEGKFIVDEKQNKVKRHHEKGEKDNLDISLSDMENQLTEQ